MRRPATIRVATLCLGVVTAAGLAGCSGDGSIDGLTVTGDFGEEPTVEVDGLDVDGIESGVLIDGDGEQLGDDGIAEARVLFVDASTGDTLGNSFAGSEPFRLEVAEQPAPIAEVMTDVTVGSRVVFAMPARELYGEQGVPQLGLAADDDIVLVFDLIEGVEGPLSGPEGKEVEPPADAPKIVEEDGTITGLDFSDAPEQAPEKFQAITLVEGEGEPVKEGDQITVDYLGTEWGDGETPFDNSFESEPTSFGVTYPGLIQGWVKGLVGVRTGSRVMLVVPPELGYGEQGNPEIDISGTDTLVFVIDVLGIE